jgi:putative FmdB family regulatory protein
MPIYEYRCPNGHLLEVFHSMSESGPAKCEVCGAAPMERVLHPVAVHYKGSGFYSTDYGRGRRKSSGEGEGSGGDSSGGDGKSGGDSKSGDGKSGGGDGKSGGSSEGGSSSGSSSSSSSGSSSSD